MSASSTAGRPFVRGGTTYQFVRETRASGVGDLFDQLWGIQKCAPRSDWVFRGQESSNWYLLPKSRRDLNMGKRSPLASLMSELLEEQRVQGPIRELLQPARKEQWSKLLTCGLGRAYHELCCIAEFQATAEFSRTADEIGLPLLDHQDAIPDKRALSSRRAPDWTPCRTTGLAQHHNVPTKLLDWSRRTKVAAYFAAQEVAELDPSEHPDLVVWALDASVLVHQTPDPRDEPLVRTFTCPHASHGFLHAQDGLFTWCDERHQRAWLEEFGHWPDLLETLAHEGFADDEVILHRVVLARKHARELREILRADRISLASMMPSYNNVALSVHERWKDIDSGTQK